MLKRDGSPSSNLGHILCRTSSRQRSRQHRKTLEKHSPFHCFHVLRDCKDSPLLPPCRPPSVKPLRVLHTAAAASFVEAHFPLWLLFYIPPPFRQRPAWTLPPSARHPPSARYSYATSASRSRARHCHWTQVPERSASSSSSSPAPRPSTPAALSMLPIIPARMGSTWYPTVYSGDSNGFVVWHFQGGASVMGDGRSDTCGYAAHILQEQHAGAAFVFCPPYRLAQNRGGRFPAPLQDAITAYAYLVHHTRHPGRPHCRQRG